MANTELFQFTVRYEPEIPEDSLHLRRKIFQNIKLQVLNDLGTHQFNNTHVIAMRGFASPFKGYAAKDIETSTS